MRALSAVVLGMTLLSTPSYAKSVSAQMHVSVTVIGRPVVQNQTYTFGSRNVQVQYSASEQSCRVATSGTQSATVTIQCDAYKFPEHAVTIAPK